MSEILGRPPRTRPRRPDLRAGNDQPPPIRHVIQRNRSPPRILLRNL
jgi:hypothetical protein